MNKIAFVRAFLTLLAVYIFAISQPIWAVDCRALILSVVADQTDGGTFRFTNPANISKVSVDETRWDKFQGHRFQSKAPASNFYLLRVFKILREIHEAIGEKLGFEMPTIGINDMQHNGAYDYESSVIWLSSKALIVFQNTGNRQFYDEIERYEREVLFAVLLHEYGHYIFHELLKRRGLKFSTRFLQLSYNELFADLVAMLHSGDPQIMNTVSRRSYENIVSRHIPGVDFVEVSESQGRVRDFTHHKSSCFWKSADTHTVFAPAMEPIYSRHIEDQEIDIPVFLTRFADAVFDEYMKWEKFDLAFYHLRLMQIGIRHSLLRAVDRKLSSFQDFDEGDLVEVGSDPYPHLAQKFKSETFADEKLALEWIVSGFPDERLTGEEWLALNGHQRSSVIPNHYLEIQAKDPEDRSGEEDQFLEDMGEYSKVKNIPLIDSAIKKSSVPTAVTVFRFMPSNASSINWDSQVGVIYSEPRLIPTTLRKEMAFNADPDENIILEIRLPEGYSATNVTRIDDPQQGLNSEMQGLRVEMELLLPRNSNFRIVDKKVENEMRVLVLEPK